MRHIKKFNDDFISEGRAYKDTKKPYVNKPWDPDKKLDFKKKIVDHIKSFKGFTIKEIGTDIEVLKNSDDMIIQVMFRDNYIGVKEVGNKFTDKYEYTELGKVKSHLTNILNRNK